MVLSSQSNLLFFKRICPKINVPKLSPQLFKPFSSLPEPQPEPEPEPQPPLPPPPKSTSLSARMSFVFDQIDAIKRERGEKEQTFHRIRAWRESKSANKGTENADKGDLVGDNGKVSVPVSGDGGVEGRGVLKEENGEVGSVKDSILVGGGGVEGRRMVGVENGEVGSEKDSILVGGGGVERRRVVDEGNGEVGSEKDLILAGGGRVEGRRVVDLENGVVGSENVVILTHPWPEWMELMERLVQQNYFDYKRKDENRLIEESGFTLGEEDVKEEVKQSEMLTNWRTVETAMFNFGRDRFDILRFVAS